MADEQKRPEEENEETTQHVEDEAEIVEEVTGGKKPEELTAEQVEEVAEAVPAPDEYPEGQAEELQERIEEEGEPTVFEEAVVEAMEVTEEAADSPVVEAFDAGVSAIQSGIEAAEGAPEHDAHAHSHGDTTVIFGKEYPIPLYTSVFIALGVLTVLEVTIAELFPAAIRIPLLLGIGIAKSLLVVIFYMHLNTDSRIFALTLAVPLGVAIISLLFLMAVPPTGY